MVQTLCQDDVALCQPVQCQKDQHLQDFFCKVQVYSMNLGVCCCLADGPECVDPAPLRRSLFWAAYFDKKSANFLCFSVLRSSLVFAASASNFFTSSSFATKAGTLSLCSARFRFWCYACPHLVDASSKAFDPQSAWVLTSSVYYMLSPLLYSSRALRSFSAVPPRATWPIARTVWTLPVIPAKAANRKAPSRLTAWPLYMS